MATTRTANVRMCGWCPNGDHARCPVDSSCACNQADHQPGVELQRELLVSRCPDMAPAIRRGVYDDQAPALLNLRDPA